MIGRAHAQICRRGDWPNRLRRRIEAGEWSDTRRLPNERDLAAEYRVARNTLRSAIDKVGDRWNRDCATSDAAPFCGSEPRDNDFLGNRAEALRRQPDRHDGGAADWGIVQR
jgi:DNA-binding transcriptional MocR family regulator